MLNSAVATPPFDFARVIDAWYPLAPLQAGMLYDALRLGRNAGYDIEQVHLVLEEPIEPALLARAFQWLTQHHDALHTEFRWDDGSAPRQRAAANSLLPVEIETWVDGDATERAARLASFLNADRRCGFDLRQAPLGRLRIFVMGPEHTEVVWTVHHIVIDALSLPTALTQAFDVYECLRQGSPPPSQGDAPAYRSYIEGVLACDRDASRSYFSELLVNRPAPPNLPGFKVAGATACPTPAIIKRQAGANVFDAVRALASRTNTSVESVIHAAWALVLARHCDSSEGDIVFGVTRGCRRPALAAEIGALVGLLANTLPIRARCDDSATVSDLLKNLRAQSVNLRSHEHMPLYEIERQGVRVNSALFNTTVTYQRWELTRELRQRGGPQWQSRACTLHEQPVPPLNLRVTEEEELEITLLFDCTSLERSAVERMSDAFLHTLGALSENEHRKLGEISVVPANTVKWMIHEWNETSHSAPENLLLHELFEAQADQQPEACAVQAGSRCLTYGELEAAANRVAHYLHERGIGKGDFIGIHLPRGVELLIALLGVAKSGASYVPLDPRYPAARITFMVEDSKARCVIAEPASSAKLTGCTQLSISEILARDDLPTSRPARCASPNSICYAIYTSGTTGNPNGVLLSHRAVVNTLDWVNRTFQVGPDDRALFVTSPCFDLSVYDVFGVLGAGATSVVASDSQLNDPRELGRLLDTGAITIWNSAPAMLNAVLALNDAYPENPCLRLALLSGDWIPLALPDAIRNRYPKARVVSLGGATEAAIWSNWYPVERIDPEWTSIPYGVPIQNCRYYVLDRKLRPSPIGVPGDLYIGGACLADGYLNRPELTRERFIMNPFVASGERLYKSGDRALFHEDGRIRLLGRQDSQVKIRGVRVELGEVEAALSKVPGVKQSVAITYTDSSTQKSVGAYVVLETGVTLDAQAVREAVSESLTSFAVPSRIVILGELPLSSNGKVDRKALPAFDERGSASAFVAPKTPLEHKLAELWETLLHVRPVGVTDDFFALGGHSLLAVTLVSQIRAQFGWDVPLERLIAKPTISALIAANARSATEPEPKHFLVFNEHGTRPPLVLVPGVYGTLFVFRQLPKYFGPDQPLYLAKDYAGTNSIGEPSVESMAALCEDELVELCKSGQVIIGGLSCGMLVAFELARRLARRGIDVPMLVSLDGMAPGYPEFLPRARRIWAHIRAFTMGDRKQYLADRLANTRRRILRLIGREHELHAEVQCASPELRRILKSTFYVNYRASRRYFPAFKYPGQLLLFRAERPERWLGIKGLDPLNGWGPYVEGKISVVVLPGDHAGILNSANQLSVVQSITEHMTALNRRALGVAPGNTDLELLRELAAPRGAAAMSSPVVSSR